MPAQAGMTIIELIGLFGIIFVAISWIPQTKKVLIEKKSGLELKFVLIYSVGSLLLLTYSILISDKIYITLNTLTTIMASINLYYALKK